MAKKRKRSNKDGQHNIASGPKKAKKELNSLDLSAYSSPTLEVRPFVETPTGEDRRREAVLYEMLGSEIQSERDQASACIISSLLESDGVSEAVLQRHLGHRLFRGLASSRNASRLGFSIVITALLEQLFDRKELAKTKYPGLTFDKTLELLVEKTRIGGNASGQEERDHAYGLLFGLMCFIQSRTPFEDTTRLNAVLDLLLQLGNKRIWMRPECGWELVRALEQMNESDAKATLVKVAEAGMAKTPEGVAAWIVTLNRYPNLKPQPWKNPLSSKSLADLTAVLKESFKDTSNYHKEEQSAAKHASWNAQLHFVWDLILKRFLSVQNSDAEDSFDQFWSRVVDDGLFSRQATDGQKFKGFMVFQKMLAGLAEVPSKLQVLFSRNLMSCLLNQAAKEDRYLHRAATKSLKTVEAVVSEHPALLAPVLKNLLGKNGSYTLDQRTNCKTASTLLQNVNEQNMAAVLAVIKQPMKTLKDQELTKAQLVVRTYIDYLTKILRKYALSAPIPSEDRAAGGGQVSFGTVLQELASLAYAQPTDLSKEILTDPIRKLARSGLETSLASRAKFARSSFEFKEFTETMVAMNSSVSNMAPEIKQAIDTGLLHINKLLKSNFKSPKDEQIAHVLALLYSISIFHLCNEEPDAMDVLEDLSQFYGRLNIGLTKEKKKKGTGKAKLEESLQDDSSSEGSSELLVEIILSMVSKPSKLMREVSSQAFHVFTSQLSAAGLQLLTEPLIAEENAAGQQALFNIDDDAMDIDIDSNVSDAETADVEDSADMANADNIEDVEDASDFELDPGMEFVGLGGDDESEEGDKEVLNTRGEWQNPEELDSILGKILDSHRLDKDAEAETSEDEGDMSDSQMFALDEQLSAAIAPHIKANKPDSRKLKLEAKQSVVNFKHRILDLLEVYMKNEPLNQHTFRLLVPLLRLMRTTSTKPLASRAVSMILAHRKHLDKARSEARAAGRGKTGQSGAAKEDRDDEAFLSILEEIHAEAFEDQSGEYARAASSAGLAVATAVLERSADNFDSVVDVYARTLKALARGKRKWQKRFIVDWVDWCQEHATPVMQEHGDGTV
ncbi:uncharacterized protein UV8b_02917 [Ustilaginoidea virens]|uniref:Uncharacterized protein n=1 Tax=Ustilaginoidea virens TaxID=1159556 RepID=A0A063BUN6_USTVR|nr:uncharacterized protein UV8b_02917 [Ustilaginoidea virens]QUC18676.1 hypothetical protein UV8b_02917 [Ustilaginoidea virens]GAO18123.1 hypothetical protein UVI_02019990 [Ustilaginoidea virens]